MFNNKQAKIFYIHEDTIAFLQDAITFFENTITFFEDTISNCPQFLSNCPPAKTKFQQAVPLKA